MRKYHGEVCNDDEFERSARIIEVEASNVQEAYDKIKAHPKFNKDEDMVYQISRDFKGCELAQPVFDFFNGFSLAGSEATAETWEEHWN